MINRNTRAKLKMMWNPMEFYIWILLHIVGISVVLGSLKVAYIWVVGI